ncbi:hypothetical protein Asera_57820 [Actinocatenispora sera]|uniref:Uncharacterized protein n=1 Tax=Actinocatenispora sera TaxID=390989 RepID=A0A810L811_9ACTN|nr:hypothetical protein Asera_57820 [Actinocatenispora sera]
MTAGATDHRRASAHLRHLLAICRADPYRPRRHGDRQPAAVRHRVPTLPRHADVQPPVEVRRTGRCTHREPTRRPPQRIRIVTVGPGRDPGTSLVYTSSTSKN